MRRLCLPRLPSIRAPDHGLCRVDSRPVRRAWRSGIKEEPRRQPRRGTAAEPGPMWRPLPMPLGYPWDALVGGVPGKNLLAVFKQAQPFLGRFREGRADMPTAPVLHSPSIAACVSAGHWVACGYGLGRIIRLVKHARPPLVRSGKPGTGGRSGLHRTA